MGPGRFEDRVVEVDGERILLPEVIGMHPRTIGISELKEIARASWEHVLVFGETGTGKDAIAKLIFQEDAGAMGARQTINCAGLSDDRANSDLFGHEKGAYTGAEDERDGLFRTCRNGIVFMDEIGELPPGVQHKMLRYLETYEVQPMGSDKVEKAKTRVIGATNSEMGSLLHDLKPRFSFALELPNLYNRKRDIFWLLAQRPFLGDGKFQGISLRALFLVYRAIWEENIRGLQRSCKQWRVVGTGVKHDNPTVLDLVQLEYSQLDYHFDAFWYFLSRVEAGGWVEDAGLSELGRREICQLLLHLLDSIEENSSSPAIPISELPSLAEGDSVQYDAAGLLDLCTQHDERYGKIEMAGEGLVDLASMLMILDEASSIYDKMDVKHKEVVRASSSDTQAMKRVRVRPCSGFMERLRRAVVDVRLWGEIPEEAPEDDLEAVMDRHDIQGVDRLICRLCAQGLSNAKIAEYSRVNVSSSTVGDRLTRFRGYEDLAPLIPPNSAGRRRKKTE